MSPAPTYPGVYIQELSDGIPAIEGVPTSITAFIGRAERGPFDKPVLIQDFADYRERFGELWAKSTMSHSVDHFFRNGGTDAIIVRVHNGGVAATFTLLAGINQLMLEAANPGAWANNLEIEIDNQTESPRDNALFKLTVREVVEGKLIREEVFDDLSICQDDDRCVERVLGRESEFLRVQGELPIERPDPGPPAARTSGSDGDEIGFSQIADPSLKSKSSGIWALDDADIFNLLCIPPFTADTDVSAETWAAAQAYCRESRAMLLIDPPSTWKSPSDVIAGGDLDDPMPTRDENAMVFFPRVKMANPLSGYQTEVFAPCGAIAGTYARTDAEQGVWKAAAGTGARLIGVKELAYTMTDDENGKLNSLGVNCLRHFPGIGHVIWGARTLAGADHLRSEWRYVTVRRLALYIEESLYRATKWAVFEPNDEPLWAEIRLSVGAFMDSLFREGAFLGLKPREAYLVKCDSETMTQNDIDLGIINIEVGFAAVRPAEFVVIRIQQISRDPEG